MSAFGRRPGVGPGGQRPTFGVARPMKGGPSISPATPPVADAANQFPPIESLPVEAEAPETLEPAHGDAMSRLAERVAASGEAGASKSEGFEASVHRIK